LADLGRRLYLDEPRRKHTFCEIHTCRWLAWVVGDVIGEVK
jgi:hypothetical protein